MSVADESARPVAAAVVVYKGQLLLVRRRIAEGQLHPIAPRMRRARPGFSHLAGLSDAFSAAPRGQADGGTRKAVHRLRGGVRQSLPPRPPRRQAPVGMDQVAGPDVDCDARGGKHSSRSAASGVCGQLWSWVLLQALQGPVQPYDQAGPALCVREDAQPRGCHRQASARCADRPGLGAVRTWARKPTGPT